MIVSGLESLAADIGALKLLPGNPRRGDVAAVARSLDTFGQRKPIVALRDGTVIAGNHTLQAAQSLGWEKIAVVWVDDDDATAKAFALADNRTAELGDYDNQALADLIAAVAEADADLLAASGWTSSDLTELLATLEPEQLPTVLTDPDDIPDAPPAKTVPGDVWLLGPHRVICGDSTDAFAWSKVLDGRRATMCFTSPPYNAGDSTKLSGNKASVANGFYGDYDDNLIADSYLDLLTLFTDTALAHVDLCVVNIQMLSGNKIALTQYIHNYRNKLADIAIWNKGHAQPAMAAGVMNSVFEFMLFFTPNDTGRRIPTAEFRGTVGNVYDGPPQRSNKFSAIHGASFPTHLPEWVIHTFDGSKRGSVIDPFAGTGSTIIAAHDTNRIGYGIELDPRYVDVICRRFQEHTGILPIAESTGREHDFMES
jgi:site-specific DNA-methyltransferase (adenine-specific)